MTFWWHFDSPIRFMRSFMQVRLAPMQISYVSIASSPPIMWKPGAHLLCTRYHVLHISFVWYLFDQISCTSHMLCLVSVWLDIMYFTCTLFDMGYGDALALLQDVLKGRLEKAVAHLVPGEQDAINIYVDIKICFNVNLSFNINISQQNRQGPRLSFWLFWVFVNRGTAMLSAAEWRLTRWQRGWSRRTVRTNLT